jgi:hypothetical protein
MFLSEFEAGRTKSNMPMPSKKQTNKQTILFLYLHQTLKMGNENKL